MFIMSDNFDNYNGNEYDRNQVGEFGNNDNLNSEYRSENYSYQGYNDNASLSGNYTGAYPKSGSYAYTAQNSEKTKKKGKNTFLKCFAALLVVGILGAASVQVFKFLKETKDELSEFTGDPSRAPVQSVNSNDTDPDTSDDQLPSLIQLASRSDAKPLPDIVDSIMPSVVGVASTFEFQPNQSFGIWGWNPQPQQGRATGTGFIITDDGYIVTNAHVIYDEEYDAGEAIEVSVLFSDETEHEATIIAYDVETDIAVLKVNETGLTPAVLGDSDELRVGELVIAVGNPLGFDLFGTVTSGIVSALNRKIDINEKNMTLIQTDAAINSGNSGGPLLNSCGQVIGINSAKMSSSYGTNMASVEGLCFAIPMKDAKSIIDDLINNGYVTGRPQIGITTNDINEAQSRYWNIPMGVYIHSVEEGSAADLAGLKVGDVIIDIDGNAVTTAEELNEYKNQHKAGEIITLTVSRSGRDIKVDVKLQEARADNANSGRTPDFRESEAKEN